SSPAPTTGSPPFETGASQSCVCCGRSLSTRDHECPQCQTPGELSRIVASRTSPPAFISILGASNAGKTVYLGMLLDLLSKGTGPLRGLPTSALSVAIQEQVIGALQNQTFPSKTPSEAEAWNWVHSRLTLDQAPKSKRRRSPEPKQMDLVAPDFAGEAIAMEIQHAGSYPAIHQAVSKSSGILLLCDALKVRDDGPSEDLFAMKLASYVAQTRAASQTPVCPALAIVFTKCDGCKEAMDDVDQFAQYHTPRLYEFCRQSFSQHAFFAASAVGSSGLVTAQDGRCMQIPFHIQPRGIQEPLHWIVQQC
ncbi:MAG: hypothetical protein AAGA03_11825, partial [Planctomycetota bacterium]